MNFNDFLDQVKLLTIGQEIEYWHFKVKYEHTHSLWIYYRDTEISIVHDKQEAILILRAMYKTIKTEFA